MKANSEKIERRALIYCEWETSRKQFTRIHLHTDTHTRRQADNSRAALRYFTRNANTTYRVHTHTHKHHPKRARALTSTTTNNNNEIYEEAQLFHSTRQRIAHNMQANKKK